MPGDRLESELRDLGRHLDVPPAPDVTTAVRHALAREPVRQLPTRRWHMPRLVQTAAALVLVFAALLTASPDVRAATIDVLRFAGIEIREDASPVPVRPNPSPLPGQRSVSLAEARAAVPFEVTVPSALGAPDAVTVADGRVVSLMYEAREGYPPILIDELGGTLDQAFAKYAVQRSELIRLGQHHVVWIDQPHPLLYIDRDGEPHEEAARMAGKTLIWQADGTVFRMEGDLTRDQAIEIARSTLP